MSPMKSAFTCDFELLKLTNHSSTLSDSEKYTKSSTYNPTYIGGCPENGVALKELTFVLIHGVSSILLRAKY